MYESRPIENWASEDRRPTFGRDCECIRREHQLEDFCEYPLIYSEVPPSQYSFSSSLWSRSRFSRSSPTPCLHFIGRSTITHPTQHPYQYLVRGTSYHHPRGPAKAIPAPRGSPETTGMKLRPQRSGASWMMTQYPRLRKTDITTTCSSLTPRKTLPYHPLNGAFPLSFHLFDTSRRNPFTIRI
jgi:hypothetical protein